MRETFACISDLINAWPSLTEFAADVGCGYGAARQMRRRNSIPAGYWLRLVSAARVRGIEGVDLQKLASLAAREMDLNALTEAAE